MDTNIYSFNQLLSICKHEKPLNLLLGNGFSIACEPKFSYKDFPISQILSPIINNSISSTTNIENIISETKYMGIILEQCCDVQSATEISSSDIATLKIEFLKYLLCIHPNYQTLNSYRINNTLGFISLFNKIFTLNYDLLLYWIGMTGKFQQQNRFKLYFNDGFSENSNQDCIWTNNQGKQNIYYLHGAIHLFSDNYNTYKIKSNIENKKNIISIINSYIQNGITPLYVLKGSSIEKERIIYTNEYLNNCYSELGEISGTLFIYGHSLNRTDQHIFDKINSNKQLQNIFISIYEPWNIVNFNNIYENTSQMFDKPTRKKIKYYDASSIKIW